MNEDHANAILWIIGILSIIVLFIFVLRSKEREEEAFSMLREADSWLESHSIDPNSVVFSTYQDSQVARVAGATIIVGMGSTKQGKEAAFALEVVPGRGVVASELLDPPGIATHHKSAFIQAKTSRRPLLDILVAVGQRRRARAPKEPPQADDPANRGSREGPGASSGKAPNRSNFPTISFVSAMPHPEVDKPLRIILLTEENIVIEYYEHPRSIGEVEAGLNHPFEKPQVSVIRIGESPALIIQTEKRLDGTLMLCSLDPSGHHTNYGLFELDPKTLPADGFIMKTIEIFRRWVA